MTIINLSSGQQFYEQAGVTQTSNEIACFPDRPVSFTAEKTGGTATTGAKIQYTLSPPDNWANTVSDTPVWVDYTLGNQVDTHTGYSEGLITGLRLVVTDATWKLQARQAI